jgi:hypothetical protein
MALALHFFNHSIDSRDKHTDTIPEDLSINDIESIAELFVEIILNQPDAFIEHEERDHESSRQTDSNTFYYSNTLIGLKDFSPNILYTHQFQIVKQGETLPSTRTIISPPPQG